ncbi:zinc finger protein 570-like isoform X2 [Agrilus planipennis]|nr:zinc finger protein 570-like isoform X2 [Agrilus planipennis]
MDGIWHFSTKEHNRKKEFLNLDNTKEETVIKTEVKDDIFESEIEFIDETRYYNIKNEPLNLNDIKEETTIQPGEENTFEGKIGLTTGIWGVFIKEDDKQKEFLNLNDIKEETVIKKELEDDIFEEEIKLNLKNINADVTDATYVELKKLKCKFCPQVYTSILDLSSHLKVHSERTSLPCSETKKKFECDICHKSHLREHSTSHREELQFECETYEQSFSQNSQSSQKTDDIVIESHNEQNPSNQRHMVTVRVDNKDVLKKARQQRYRERHREEINKRKRASALNKERERRQFLQNEQRIATGQITEATSNDQLVEIVQMYIYYLFFNVLFNNKIS